MNEHWLQMAQPVNDLPLLHFEAADRTGCNWKRNGESRRLFTAFHLPLGDSGVRKSKALCPEKTKSGTANKERLSAYGRSARAAPNFSFEERCFVPLVHRLCAPDQDANPRRCVQNLSLRVQIPHWETEKYRYPRYVLVPGCRGAPIKTRSILLDYLSPRHSQIWTPDCYWKQ